MSTTPDPTQPYGTSAKRYLKLGWLPIPVSGKAYPEPGTTGKKGTVTAESAKGLINSRRRHNVALRHDGTTMSLDVDGADHDGKSGEKTMRRLTKAKHLGELPPAWSSTARGDDSPTRQHFYRVPEGVKLISDLTAPLEAALGRKLEKDEHADVEVIHHDHRYSVVAPSVHPDTGAEYQWYDPQGRPSDYPPHVDELTTLPRKWLEALSITPYVKPAAPGKTKGKAKSKAVEQVGDGPLELTKHDRDKIARWLGTAIDGIIADLKAMTDAATGDPAKYRGDPWDATTFKKAVRLAELAYAEWSPLTLDEAEAILYEHAPRDRGFTDRNVGEKWASAVRTARGTELEIPVTLGGGDVPEVFTIPLTEVEQRRQRLHPDTFFDNKTGLLAERLADAVAHDLAVGLDGRIWEYEGGVWQPADDGKGRNAVRTRVIRLLGDRYRREHGSIALDVVLARPDLPRIGDEPDPDFINTQSGMVEWSTGKLHPHDPARLSTIQLPVDYDPDAECPKFDKWLKAVVAPDLIPLMWQVMGYLLMSGNPLQTAVLLLGNGGNGKGTWLRLMTHLIGHHNVSNVTLHDIAEGKFEVAQMYGKLANIAGDIEARSMNNTAKFKALTGEDTILVQHKHGQPFRMTAWAVPVFSANQLWQSADNTRGYLRRWLVLPFPHELKGGGRFNERKLFAEAPGIFAKAMVALRELMEVGEFDLGASAAEVKRKFELESDVVKLWLADDERVVVSEAGNTSARTGRTEAYKRYTQWASDSGHGALNSSNFYRRLESMGYTLGKSNGARIIYGLRIETPDIWHTHPDLKVSDPS